MLKTTSWAALVLATVGTVPVAMHAGPFGLFGGSESKETTRAADNAVLQDVAGALRAANLQYRDVEIEYEDGTVTLTGFVADATQRARATQAVSHVPGVDNVINQMRVAGNLQAAAARGTGSTNGAVTPAVATRPANRSAKRGAIRQASFEDDFAADEFGAEEFGGEEFAAAPVSNQQVAQQIATALSQQNLSDYDIRIHYQDGIATLIGSVATEEQWQRATRAAGNVANVQRVVNRMQVGPARTAGVTPAGYRQDPPMDAPPGIDPGAGGPPMGPPPGWQPPPAPPQPYGHPGAGMANQAYSMPNLPAHAWPAQAAYPNSAQISYPQMYSASAWPYIGPFYPYPQVPLGWREAQLEWDDGFWHLNFRPRTSKWFWFVSPRNW